MAIVKTINVSISAVTTGFEKGLARASTRLSAFVGSTVSSLAGLAGASLSIYGVGAAMSSTIKTAEEFAKAMAQSTAIMADVTDDMRARMEVAAQQVAYNTKFSATEAAQAYFFLASAGLNAEQSIAALPVVAKFAQAGMFDLSTATDMLVQAQTAMGLKSTDAAENMQNMARIANVLVKGNILTTTTVQDLAAALTNDAAGALRLTNKSVEEGVAVLSAFAAQGVVGQEAGTQLAIVLRDLKRQAIDNAAAFDQAGVAVFDAQDNMRPMWDIIRDLEKALAGLSDKAGAMKLMELGFQEKSVKATQTLLGTSGQMKAWFDEMKAGGNVVDEVASKNIPKFTMGMKQLSAIMEAFKIQAGTSMMESLMPTKPSEGIGVLAEGLAIVLDIVSGIHILWLTMKPAIIAIQSPIDTIKMIISSMGIGMAQLTLLAVEFVKSFPAAIPFRGSLEEIERLANQANADFLKMNDSTVGLQEELAKAGAELKAALVNQSPGDKFRAKIAEMQKSLADLSQGPQDTDKIFGGQAMIDSFSNAIGGIQSAFAPLGQSIGETFGTGFGMAKGYLGSFMAGIPESVATDVMVQPVELPSTPAVTGGILANETMTAFLESGKAVEYSKQQTEYQKRMEQHLAEMNRSKITLAPANLPT